MQPRKMFSLESSPGFPSTTEYAYAKDRENESE